MYWRCCRRAALLLTHSESAVYIWSVTLCEALRVWKLFAAAGLRWKHQHCWRQGQSCHSGSRWLDIQAWFQTTSCRPAFTCFSGEKSIRRKCHQTHQISATGKYWNIQRFLTSFDQIIFAFATVQRFGDGKIWICLFRENALNWSKRTVKTFIMPRKMYISNKCCSFELSIHLWILKN